MPALTVSLRSARRGVRLWLLAAYPESYCRTERKTAHAERKRHAQHNGGDITEKLWNLQDRICSFENLLAAYRKAIEDKRYRDEVIAFSFNLEENLVKLRDELLSRTYAVGPYREFYVHYPKARLVMALGFRDRIVQWAIYRQLNPYMDKRFIQHSYGCRENKGTLAAAECLLNWVQLISRKPDAHDWVIVKCDISKYFYRVDHDTVMRIYEDISDDDWFLWLISSIIRNPDVPFGLPDGMSISDCPRESRLFDVGMPIGNLTSQETANIYLDRLDQYVKHVLRQHYYVRYMDDFCILCRKEDAQRLMDCIAAFLHDDLRLSLSPKSRIVPVLQPVEFVGYIISPYGMRIRRKSTRHMKRALLYTADLYADGIIEIDDALNTVNSYMGMTEHCSGYNIRRWIEDNVVFQRKDALQMAQARDRPKKFYHVADNADGTVDVFLQPVVTVYHTDAGIDEYDVRVRVVRGIVPWDGMEDDIRARFDAWCEEAEVIDL